jgi:SAM-dependent methyltransferase
MHSDVWTSDDAAFYDDDVAGMFEPDELDPAVDFLARLAAGGRVLEFAVGTGRVALPLVARSAEVVGIELSRPMIDAMRAKPGGDRIPVTCGDMATTRVDGSFELVYLVFNTVTNLLTQDAQVACFANAARHLEPGGCFVVETFVPALQRLPFGERLVPFEVSDEHIGVDEYDVVDQTLVSHHVRVRPDGVVRSKGRFRYAWPAEYDLMARIAGLRLRERWADWHRAPFTSLSTSHVSVWELPG